MFKKYMAMFMACAIALTLSVPMIAFASSSTYSGEAATPDELSSTTGQGKITMKYTSVTQIPVLNVKITNHGGLILNPYMLKYNEADGRASFDASSQFKLDLYGGSSGSDYDADEATYRQIISTPMVIESTTEVPILVGVSVETKVPNGGVTLKSVDLIPAGKKGADTGKSVYMWLAAASADDEEDCIQRALALDPTTSTDNTLVLTETKDKVVAVKNDKFVTIPAAGEDEDEATYAAFVFGGRMVVEPTITDKTGTTPNPWSSEDKVTPTVTLNLSLTGFDWSSDKNSST